jgi:hypothetical protein
MNNQEIQVGINVAIKEILVAMPDQDRNQLNRFLWSTQEVKENKEMPATKDVLAFLAQKPADLSVGDIADILRSKESLQNRDRTLVERIPVSDPEGLMKEIRTRIANQGEIDISKSVPACSQVKKAKEKPTNPRANGYIEDWKDILKKPALDAPITERQTNAQFAAIMVVLGAAHPDYKAAQEFFGARLAKTGVALNSRESGIYVDNVKAHHPDPSKYYVKSVAEFKQQENTPKDVSYKTPRGVQADDAPVVEQPVATRDTPDLGR